MNIADFRSGFYQCLYFEHHLHLVCCEIFAIGLNILDELIIEIFERHL